MTNLPITQTNIQLYNCTDEAVQNFIINTQSEQATRYAWSVSHAEIKSHGTQDLIFINCTER